MSCAGTTPSNGTDVENLLSTGNYDFLDFGASNGGCMDFARARLGGLKGLGIDQDPKAVERARKLGYDCIEGDITSLDLPANCVRFITISHTLEHLPTLVEVRKTLELAAKAATNFLFIQGPYFDADALLRSLGLKFFWSDWYGHPCHLTTEQLRRILGDIGHDDHVMMARLAVNDSLHRAIHPLNSPRDQHEYIPGYHPEKPFVVFEPPLYEAIVCYVQLRPVPNWHEIIRARKGCHRIHEGHQR